MALFTINNPKDSTGFLPGTPAGPGQQFEFAIRITPTVNGFITAVRFYKPNDGIATRNVNVWSLAGTLLATASSGVESVTTGWVEVPLAIPFATVAGTSYYISAAGGQNQRIDAAFPGAIPAILGSNQAGYFVLTPNTWSPTPTENGGVWRLQDVVFSDTPPGPPIVQATSNFREADRFFSNPGTNRQTRTLGRVVGIGDSFTAGDGASSFTFYQNYQLATRLTPSLSNAVFYAIGGAQIAEITKSLYSATVEPPFFIPTTLYNFAPLFNDVRFIDNEPARIAAYAAVSALVAHLLVKGKALGTASTRIGWAASDPLAYPGAISSATQGDTATFTTNGTVVYIHGMERADSGSLVRVAIDGVVRGAFSFNRQIVQNNAGERRAGALIRIPGLAAGAHTVVLTMLAAEGGLALTPNVTINWVGGNTNQSNSPIVSLATVADLVTTQAIINSPFDKRTPARVADTVQAALDIAAVFQADGWANNMVISRWDSIVAQPGVNLAADQVHRNDAGQTELANVIENALTSNPNIQYPLPGAAQLERIFLASVTQPTFVTSNFREADRFFAQSGLPVVISAVTPLVAGPGEKVILTVDSTVGLTGVSIQGVQALGFTVLSATSVEVTLPYGVSGQGQFTAARGPLAIATGPFITINPRLGAASSNKSRNRKYYGLD
jgi:Domain of unknown function (DUF4082)